MAAVVKKKEKKKRKLTDQQLRFVHEYCIDQNASAAAERAGYSGKTKGQLGYQLLQIPSIRDAIKAHLNQINERLGLTKERVLLELYRCATVDIGHAYDEGGRLKNIKDIPEDVRRAMVGVETHMEVTGGQGEDADLVEVKKAKFVDKNRSLELLAKHFKLLVDKIEIKDSTGLAERLSRARKRKEGKSE